MNRQEYERLLGEIKTAYEDRDSHTDLFATRLLDTVLVGAGIEIPEPEPKPVSEQTWCVHAQYHDDHHRIHNEEGQWIATGCNEEMRDIILGIPALVKACLEQGIIYNSIADALETMGLIDSDGKAK